MSYTLVIASYQYGHLAAHAIESALEQTKPFDRILFVDDGVGDCNHLPDLYPEVEYHLRDENLGTVRNFEDMLTKVTTDYVMFLGADNWLRPDALEVLTFTPADVTTYDIMVVGDRKQEIYKRHKDEITPTSHGLYWDRSSGHHGSMLYNTELARSVGGYESPPGRTLEDMVLYHKLLEAGAKRIHVSKPLLYYRRHRENFNPC